MFEAFFSERLIWSAGWTIVHSLWQGTLAALLLGIILWISQEKRAEVRYAISLTALAVFFTASVLTFSWYYSGYAPEQAVVVNENYAKASSSAREVFTEAELAEKAILKGLLAEAGSFFESRLNYIVILWAAGIMIFSLKFAAGHIYLIRIRRRSEEISDPYLLKQFEDLRKKTLTNQKVSFLISHEIYSPITSGIIKPAILFPAALLSGLSPEQVEVILIHEFTHIRRHDYLVNIFQAGLEIIFFFNPAVWWISGKIKEEREDTCDDAAIELSGKKLIYARTLLAVAENKLKPAIPLSGKANKLYRRIERMTLKKNKNGSEARTALSVFFVVTLMSLLMYACSGEETVKSGSGGNPEDNVNAAERLEEPARPEKPEAPEPPRKVKDGEKLVIFSTSENGNSVTWEAKYDKSGELVYIKKEGRDLSGEEFNKAKKIVKREMADVSQEDGQFIFLNKSNKDNFAYFDSLQLDESMKELSKNLKNMKFNFDFFKNDSLNEAIQKKIEMGLNHIPDMDSIFGSAEFREGMDEALRQIEEMKIVVKNKKFEGLDSLHKRMSIAHVALDSAMEKLDIKLQLLDKNMGDVDLRLKDVDIKLKDVNIKVEKINKFVDKLREELYKDGYIDDPEEDFDLELSTEKMSVNGRELPEELRTKYIDMYEEIVGHTPKGTFQINGKD